MGIEITPVLTMDCFAPSPKQIRTRNKGQKEWMQVFRVQVPLVFCFLGGCRCGSVLRCFVALNLKQVGVGAAAIASVFALWRHA